MWKNVILTLLLCMVLAVQVQAGRELDYDINRDGYIDISDIGNLASAWLEHGKQQCDDRDDD
jgi:hypothetical protein